MDNRAPALAHVVAMPYPGRGHINPMLNLCRLLSSRGVLITFVVTEEWLGLLGSAADSLPPNIVLRTIPNVIPSEHDRAADLTGFLEAAYTKIEEPFERLLDKLEPREVSAIIADTYLPWAVAVGERRDVPVCSLFPMSASVFSVLYHFGSIFGSSDYRQVEPTEINERLEQYVPGVKLAALKSVGAMDKTLQMALDALVCLRKAKCLLFTSFYELEAPVIDKLLAEFQYPIYPIGPSIPYTMLEEKPSKPVSNNGNINVFSWLDSQPENSVLYVSLGSFLSVTGSQMEEIAMGLHDSGIRFLWVARGDSSRMQEITGDKGLVVPWCDQLKVLCHFSIGGFFTHCGWNSTLEAVFAGLPMLALPIAGDQPVDGSLIVNVWKVGLSAVEEAGEENFLEREHIVKVVKKLMDGAESREMRRRAIELQKASCKAIKEGGSSYTNLSAFIKDVMQGFDC